MTLAKQNDMKVLNSKLSNIKKRNFVLGVGGVLLMAIVALTHDIIMTNFLAYRLCQADPTPKTFIKRTVEYPESIHFEDHIYPGFDEQDQLLMIRNYLDGEHLTTMALNRPDGTIVIFTATPADWQASRSKEKSTPSDYSEYSKIMEAESRAIAGRAQTVTKESMPKLKYRVAFTPVKLTDLERKYLYSDEVTITDTTTGEAIAYNRRLMRFWYAIAPDIAVGNRYYYPQQMCGDEWLYGFEKRSFLAIRSRFGNFHGMDINYYLYDKFIKTGGTK
jgi:hypothetical protein